MTLEELFIYGLVVFVGSALGIPFGSWLNSKLLTKTLKGELRTIKKESQSSPEYKMLMELLGNVNETLKTPEAKNVLQNINKLVNEVRIMLIKSPNNEPLLKMPDPPKKEEKTMSFAKEFPK